MGLFATATRFCLPASLLAAALSLGACDQRPSSGAPKVYVPSVQAPEHAFSAYDGIPRPRAKPRTEVAKTETPEPADRPASAKAAAPWSALARAQIALLSLDRARASTQLEGVRKSLETGGKLALPPSFAAISFAHAGELHTLRLPFNTAKQDTASVMALVGELRRHGMEAGDIVIQHPASAVTRQSLLVSVESAIGTLDKNAAGDPSYGQLMAEDALDKGFQQFGMVEATEPPGRLLGSYLSLAHAAYQARYDEFSRAALERAQRSYAAWRKRSAPDQARATKVEQALEQLDAALRKRQDGPLERVRQGLQALLG